MPTQFKNKYEFGADLKTKMPQYADMDNYELADKILAKYPQYKSLIPEEKGIFGRIGSAIGNNITDITDVFDGKINKTPDQSGYIGNVIRSGGERLGRVGQNFSQIGSVKPKGFFDIGGFGSILGNAVQNVGEVAGWVSNDIMGGAVSGAVGTLASDKLKAGVYEAGKDIAGTSIGKKGLETIGTATQKWGDFSQKYPEASATVAGAGNIGSLALDLVGGGLAKKALTGTIPSIKSAGKTIANNVPNPINVAKKIPATGLGETIVATSSGISRSSQQAIKNAPDLYKMARTGGITREGLSDTVVGAIKSRMDDISDLGKGYEKIRQSPVSIQKSDIGNIAQNYLKKSDISYIDLPVKDRKVIQQAIDYIGEYGDTMTAKNGLSLRSKLDDLASWGTEATDAGKRVIRGLRREVDDFLGQKIPGLKDLDTKYAPERKFLGDVKKIMLNVDGSVKDNAISTVANITGKGKEAKLARIEKLVPGITKKVQALKAFEEIQGISELKTGSIMRQLSGVAVGSSTGPVGMIAGFIATNPNFVARALESYGRAKPYIKNLLSRGKNISKSEADDVIKALKNTPKKDFEKSLISSFAGNTEPQKTAIKRIGTESMPSLRSGVNSQAQNASYGIPKPITNKPYLSAPETNATKVLGRAQKTESPKIKLLPPGSKNIDNSRSIVKVPEKSISKYEKASKTEQKALVKKLVDNVKKGKKAPESAEMLKKIAKGEVDSKVSLNNKSVEKILLPKIDLSPITAEAKKYKTVESFKKALKTKVWSKEVLNNLKPIFDGKSQREIGDILESIFFTGKLPTKKITPQVSRIVDGIDLENIPF